jgi:hypothetical protein
MAFTGRRALKDVDFAMNIVVDGCTQAEVDFALGEIRAIALPKGAEVEATVPRAVRGTPFLPPNDILGPKGERWAPSHGIAPHSRAVALTDQLHAFFEEREAMFEQLGIEWGYVAFAISSSAILLEPMLYWPGERELYHERVISPAHLAKLPVCGPSPEAAEAMRRLRSELTQFWLDQGCAHLQIGKTYRYLENLQPAARGLLETIKAHVDPKGLVNPGALGLGS